MSAHSALRFFRFASSTFLLALLLIPSGISAQTRAEDLFQQALRIERVSGELEEAIRIYQQVVETGDRALGARALIRIAESYDKLGRQGAQDAYTRIIQDFADQTEQVELARERLAALEQPAPSAPPTLTLRRLENPPADAPMGQPSPDGRYLSFWDWETGDLAVRDLRSGRNRKLTDEGVSWGEEAPVFQEAGESVWSPDSREVAYAWYIGSAVELRIVGLEGGDPRVLAQYPDGGRPGLFDWSPDGKWILLSQDGEAGGEEIVIISTADGTTRTLGSTNDDFYSNKMRFSPDGHYVIYNALQDPDYPERDIFLLSIESGEVTSVIQHPADDFLLGWSTDGRWLAFASDRGGSIGMWVVGMADGKPQGMPQLVRDGIGRALPMGLTRDGALFYGIVRAAEDVYFADLDPETGRVVGDPRKAIEDHEGTNYAPAFSPDGKYLAYISKRGSSPYPTNVGNTLCIRSLETGQTREFYREFWRIGVRVIHAPEWSPDGRFILLPAAGSDSRIELYRFDLMTDQIRRIVTSDPSESLLSGRFGPDGRYFLARGNEEANSARIVALDLNTGDEREVYRFPYIPSRLRLRVSPDGRWLSFLNNDNGRPRSLRIIPTEGGSPREIWSFGETGPGTPSLEHWWTPDGQHILFKSLDDEPFQRELWRIAVQGGQPERIGVLALHGAPLNLSVHPNGRQIAFASRGDFSTASEVWVMENFLPTSQLPAGNGG